MSKRTYVTKQQSATAIFDAYTASVDTPITDRELVRITGLTPTQISYGKQYLRDVVAADENYMYVATPRGCYLTRRTDDARRYVGDQSRITRRRASRIISGTIVELAERDPAAKLVLRGYERLVEDLEFLAEMSEPIGAA